MLPKNEIILSATAIAAILYAVYREMQFTKYHKIVMDQYDSRIAYDAWMKEQLELLAGRTFDQE